MRVTNEQRDIMRAIHSLALAAGDCGLRASVTVSSGSTSVWHDLYISRGDETLYRSSVVIDPYHFDNDITLEQQRDALATLISEQRRVAA